MDKPTPSPLSPGARSRRKGDGQTAGSMFADGDDETRARGARIYAIGDIHGRADLFAVLIRKIAADAASRTPRSTTLVVLGDVVDRGPDSAALLRRFMRYTSQTDDVIVLKGNHERMMVQALAGDVALFGKWLSFGGEATLQSFGLDAATLRVGSVFEMIKAARQRVGEDVLDWLDRLPLIHRSGDVVFVHAGLKPGIPLDLQRESDLLWIGDEFLDSEEMHPGLVVHGHSIEEGGPVIKLNRVGVDTGAYRTGRLSAVRLEDGQVSALST